VFRGPGKNIELRLLLAAQKHNLYHIVRVTGDDLLSDIWLIDEAIVSHREHNADYTYMKGVVYSCDIEIISYRAPETIVERAAVPDNTEYLTWYLNNATSFVLNLIEVQSDYSRDYRLTLDTNEDLQLFEYIFNELYKPGKPVDLRDALVLLGNIPDKAAINKQINPRLNPSELDTSMRI
jgi:N,N'-diacetyllegionaminate synthase